MDVVDEKVCPNRDCDGKLEQVRENDFEGNKWVCEKCGSVFKSNIGSNKKLKAFKIKNKLDFIKWIFTSRWIQAIFIALILIKLITNPFYDIAGFIIMMCLLFIVILSYGFLDPLVKKDYFESKGVNWRE